MKKKYVATLHEFVDPYTAAALVVKAGETLVKKYAGGLFSKKEKVDNTTSASKLKTTSTDSGTNVEQKAFEEFEKQSSFKNLNFEQLVVYTYVKNYDTLHEALKSAGDAQLPVNFLNKFLPQLVALSKKISNANTKNKVQQVKSDEEKVLLVKVIKQNASEEKNEQIEKIENYQDIEKLLSGVKPLQN